VAAVFGPSSSGGVKNGWLWPLHLGVDIAAFSSETPPVSGCSKFSVKLVELPIFGCDSAVVCGCSFRTMEDETNDDEATPCCAGQRRPNEKQFLPDWLQLTPSDDPDHQMENIKFRKVKVDGVTKNERVRTGEVFYRRFAKCKICAGDPYAHNTAAGRGEWLEPKSWFSEATILQHQQCRQHRDAVNRLKNKVQATTRGGIAASFAAQEHVTRAKDLKYNDAKEQQIVMQLKSAVRTVLKMAYSATRLWNSH